MPASAGRLRDRHRPDVMELLARARPASLDHPGRREGMRPEEAAAALAAAAEAVPDGPVAWMPTAGGPPMGGRWRLRMAALTGAGLALVAGGAAVAVALTAAPAAPPHATPARPAVLTAAMVRHVASASRSALAHSGRAVIRYRSWQNGVLQEYGADTITFSRGNWNDAFRTWEPATGGQPAASQSAINRIVNGQAYYYIPGRTRRPQWYHDTNPSGHPDVTVPDPRRLLRVLAPSTRFVPGGYQVIGGVRLKVLRAASPGELVPPGLRPIAPAGGRLVSLRVWVDSRDVVRRLDFTVRHTVRVIPMRFVHLRSGVSVIEVPNRALLRQVRAKERSVPAAARMRVRLYADPHATVRLETQMLAESVTFSQIGQPQRITVPAHAIPVYGHG